MRSVNNQCRLFTTIRRALIAGWAVGSRLVSTGCISTLPRSMKVCRKLRRSLLDARARAEKRARRHWPSVFPPPLETWLEQPASITSSEHVSEISSIRGSLFESDSHRNIFNYVISTVVQYIESALFQATPTSMAGTAGSGMAGSAGAPLFIQGTPTSLQGTFNIPGFIQTHAHMPSFVDMYLILAHICLILTRICLCLVCCLRPKQLHQLYYQNVSALYYYNVKRSCSIRNW